MSICERCRAAGEKLYLKGEKCFTPKCPFTRRPYPPGQGGEAKAKSPRRADRMSDFARQLTAKQKLKQLYGLRERQLRRFYRTATTKPGQTGLLLLSLLELRLDRLIVRAGLEVSPGAARQAIAHGRVMVNGRKVTTKSYIVRVGDTIAVAALTASQPWEPKNLPAYLDRVGDQAVSVERVPLREEMPAELDEQAVVAYLKR